MGKSIIFWIKCKHTKGESPQAAQLGYATWARDDKIFAEFCANLQRHEHGQICAPASLSPAGGGGGRVSTLLECKSMQIFLRLMVRGYAP